MTSLGVRPQAQYKVRDRQPLARLRLNLVIGPIVDAPGRPSALRGGGAKPNGHYTPPAPAGGSLRRVMSVWFTWIDNTVGERLYLARSLLRAPAAAGDCEEKAV